MLMRRRVGENSEVGKVPHFSTKEGEREIKWVTRPQSLAEVGAERGLAWRGSLGGSRYRNVSVWSPPRRPQVTLWSALPLGSPRVLASGVFRYT